MSCWILLWRIKTKPLSKEGFINLRSNIRKQSHESRALDSGGELALHFCWSSRSLASHNAGIRGEELFQELGVLVVDVLDVVLLKVAVLFHIFVNLLGLKVINNDALMKRIIRCFRSGISLWGRRKKWNGRAVPDVPWGYFNFAATTPTKKELTKD